MREKENDLKNSLYKTGFNFKKSLGQNFLTDETLLEEIVSLSDAENAAVLEIGCGAGALTKALLKKAKKVIGYEIDLSLKPVLDQIAKENPDFTVVYKDVMKESLEDIEKKTGENYVMVANLPYYITTPVVTRFLENSSSVKRMVIMVQEEVANRLAAKPSSPDYGAITVAVNLRGEAKIVKRVGREKFTPAPSVDSAVVRIDIDKNKFTGADFAAVRETVRCGFSSRRKTLVNNIINVYKTDRKTAEEILNRLKIGLTARGETLSAEDYVKLSEELKRIKK